MVCYVDSETTFRCVNEKRSLSYSKKVFSNETSTLTALSLGSTLSGKVNDQSLALRSEH